MSQKYDQNGRNVPIIMDVKSMGVKPASTERNVSSLRDKRNECWLNPSGSTDTYTIRSGHMERPPFERMEMFEKIPTNVAISCAAAWVVL
jgi:hypothetical protein